MLDEVQKAKINYSHIVLVVDKDGYIGSSTKEQIRHAEFLNKPIFYYSQGDEKKLLERGMK